MLLFQFKNSDSALKYWQVICELKIDDLKERQEILLDFAKHGEMERVQYTNRTKEQIIEDWSKRYHVMDVQAKREEENG